MPRTICQFDRLLRRYGSPALFLALLLGVLLLWSAYPSHAAANESTELRIGIVEDQLREAHKELSEISHGTSMTLADHEHRLTVLADHQEAMVKELDEISGYIKWLVLGVLGLVGLTAWEKLVSPRRRSDDPPSGGSLPLFKLG